MVKVNIKMKIKILMLSLLFILLSSFVYSEVIIQDSFNRSGGELVGDTADNGYIWTGGTGYFTTNGTHVKSTGSWGTHNYLNITGINEENPSDWEFSYYHTSTSANVQLQHTLQSSTGDVVITWQAGQGSNFLNGQTYTGLYNVNQNYKVEYKNINFDTQTFEFWHDGVLINDSVPFNTPSNNISSINIRTYFSSTGGFNYFKQKTFDSFSIEAYEKWNNTIISDFKANITGNQTSPYYVYDSITNEYVGTRENNQTKTNFDGVDDYINISSIQDIEATQTKTIMFWYKGGIQPNTKIIDTTERFIIGFGHGDCSTDGLFIYDGSVKCMNITKKLNTWEHYAFVYSSLGTYLKIYVDGVLNQSTPVNSYNLTNEKLLGKTISSTSTLEGEISKISFWNTSVSQTFVTTEYNTGKNTPTTQPTNLINEIILGEMPQKVTYESENGVILTNIPKTTSNEYNITTYKQDYFLNQTNNVNMTLVHQVYLYQSIITPICEQMITNKTLVCLNTTIYPPQGNISISISAQNHYNIVQEQEINPLDNKTLLFSNFYTTLLNISAIDYKNNSINSFTIYANGVNYTSYSENQTTTTGNVYLGLINGTYELTIDNSDYEYKTYNVTIQNISQDIELFLYTTNSILFLFRDENTNNLITTEKISIELISDVSSDILNTTNGTIYIDLLSPALYNMRYVGNTSYLQERFYYFTLVNRTFNNLSFYLLNDSLSTNITLTIYDQYNTLLEDAYINIQKYDINTNTYTTKEIVKTNFGGQATFLGELNTEYYKFILEYPKGTIVKTTSPSYLFTDSLILKVVLGETSAENFDNYMSLSYDLIFNNETNNFKLNYLDSTGIINNACLYVYKQKIAGNILIDSSCSTSASATILISVTPENGTTYLAKAYADLDGTNQLLESYIHTFNAENPYKNDNSGLIYVIIIEILIILITFWNLPLMIGFAPFGLIISSMLGFLDVSIGVLMGIQIISIIIAIMISNKS